MDLDVDLTDRVPITRYINLLSNVEHTAESLNSGIPSWIPRWDLCLTRAGYSFAPADSAYPVLTTRQGLVSQPTVLLNSSLKAKAAIFDSVIYASDTFNISTTTPRTLLNTWRALENFRHKTPYPPRHMLSVFISALTTGTREGDFSNWLRSEIAYYTMLYKGSQYPQDLKAPSSLYVNHDATINLLHNTIKGVSPTSLSNSPYLSILTSLVHTQPQNHTHATRLHRPRAGYCTGGRRVWHRLWMHNALYLTPSRPTQPVPISRSGVYTRAAALDV
jgi:hypothetical protein